MQTKDPFELSLEDLSLAPLEQPSKPAPKAPAHFKIDTRGKNERRTHAERREAIRFEADRRTSKDHDRRAGPSGWTLGTDI